MIYDIIVEVNYSGCSSQKVKLYGFGVNTEELEITANAIFMSWGSEYSENEIQNFFKSDEKVLWWYEDSKQFSIEKSENKFNKCIK